MSQFKFQNIKRFKRGAKLSNGEGLMCTRCNTDPDQKRSRQAVVTAELFNTRVPASKRIVVPVAYCQKDIPEEIRS